MKAKRAMDLFCLEFSDEPKAYSDPVFLDDKRVLENLMCTEERYTISLCYFKCLQTELKPYMRKVVANWMMEVCEEERCQDEVFPLAMNILDRFLAIVKIRKSQLQLVGGACLLIASKLRQFQSLSPQVLSYYTDNSVSVNEIIGWELLVLSRLKWDVSAVVATDYLDHLLMGIISNQNNENTLKNFDSIIRRHSSTFIALCTTELEFSQYTPSLIACASIATAIHGIQLKHEPWKSFDKFINILEKISGINSNIIQECVDQIEALIEATQLTHNLVGLSPTFSTSNSTNCQTDGQPVKNYVKYVNDVNFYSKIKCVDNNMIKFETPTDIQDIYF